MSSEEVQKWVKRNNRKRAKLVSKRGGVYEIVYFDRGKVRVGSVEDGQYCRYGIKSRGAMYSTDPMSLWQSGPGACSIEDVNLMQQYLEGTCSFPDFDFGQIKDLRW